MAKTEDASSSFWRFSEKDKATGRVVTALSLCSFVFIVLAWCLLPPGSHWPQGLLLGLIAWGAIAQGIRLWGGLFTLSLELAVYLYAFLTYGLGAALLALQAATTFTIVYGLAGQAANRNIFFVLRKAENVFVLGTALVAAAYAYTRAGGIRPLDRFGFHEALGLLCFWAVFTLVNNILFLPLDYASDKKHFFRNFLREATADGFLHALSLLSGSGFALIGTIMGLFPVFLLLPVFAVAIMALRHAMENRQVLARQLDLLTRLNQGSASLHQSLNLKTVLDETEQVCRNLFDADTYFLALLDERTMQMEYARAVDQGRVLRLEPANLAQGLTGHVMRTGQALFINDILRESPWNSMVRREGDPRHRIRSIMMAPLIAKERAIGVLSVQSISPSAYEPFQAELFLSVCQQVVTAVAAARLYKRATEDGLTKLYNKSFFEERLAACLAEGTPFGLVFMDCDDFKSINDRFGHVAGDQYLEELGKLIGNLCRAQDIACRYGGDEFAVLLQGASRQDTINVAKRLAQAIGTLEYATPQGGARTTVSAGFLVAEGPVKLVPLDDVIRCVDAALYRAKRTKNAVEEASLKTDSLYTPAS
ncbi:MAG: GGDEF domain-containing protein [Acidobacteria bacterium]|nr:GGDEF domain-containing protein [Acidobacteriota bacterium]